MRINADQYVNLATVTYSYETVVVQYGLPIRRRFLDFSKLICLNTDDTDAIRTYTDVYGHHG